MKYRITLEVDVPDGTSMEDAEEYFQYATDYSYCCGNSNPLLTADIATTDFDIMEIN